MKLRVGQKVNLGSALSALVILLIVTAAFMGRQRLIDALQKTKERFVITDSLNQLQSLTQELINHETDYIVTHDQADYNKWDASLQRLRSLIDTVEDRLDTPQLTIVMDDFVLAQFEYRKYFSRIHGLISRAREQGSAMDSSLIQRLYGTSLQQTRVAARVMIESAREMIALNQQIAEQSSREAIATVERIEIIISVLAVLGILTTIILRFFAIRTFSQPLAMLATVSHKMARGEFDLELNIESDDEIGQLARSFQEMASALSSLYATLEEKVAQRTEELARSNADLEQFAYVASHDLQEPLRTMSGFAELLARRYRGKLDAKADQYIDFLTAGAKRMQDLVQALLTYSRVGSKEKPFAELDCAQLVEEARAFLEATIEESHATIVVDPLPVLLGERVQLVQLFQNLIANAIKFRGSDPLRIHISAQQKDDVWEFSMADNGIGMEPRHTERIFGIFQRLHTREEYEGAGLGLAICKKVVNRHGGRIWAESQPDQGTTFRWTIPTHKRQKRDK